MKYILFIIVLIFISKAKGQFLDDDIQKVFEHFWNTQKANESHLTLNPDTGLNISQFLEKYGYPLEYHDVTTEDGYILTMHRIPYGRNAQIEQQMVNKTKPVMFLVHCLACSSMDFIWQGPNISLAFLLADLGYDVWLANGRGNVHSMRHKTLTPSNPDYWDYSFHEKGYYDMPASIDFILNHTKLDNITYIGHSQGTTEGVVLTSTRPEYNKKINLMVLLSPIVYIENVKSPIITLFAKYQNAIKLLLKAFHFYSIPYGPLIPRLTKELCNEDNPFQYLCITMIELIIGFDIPQIDKTTLTVFLSNTPNGVSIKEIDHYGQEINSEYFRRYDFGNLGNMLHYGSVTPPSYNISEITVPIAAYYSKNDYLSTVSDVEKFLSKLPKEPVEKYLIEYDLFNHLDFVTAKDVKTILYDKLIEHLHKYSPVL